MLLSGQLASEAVFWKADALVALYTKIADQESRTLVADFMVDVNLHGTLTEIVRTLRRNYPQAFSGEEEREVPSDKEPKGVNLKKKANVKSGTGHHKQTEVQCMTYVRGL